MLDRLAWQTLLLLKKDLDELIVGSLKEDLHHCIYNIVVFHKLLPLFWQELPICVKKLKSWLNLIQLPPHKLLPLAAFYPPLYTIASNQDRGDSLHYHLWISLRKLIIGAIENVPGKCSILWLEEVSKPLDKLVVENSILLKYLGLVFLELLQRNCLQVI